jgi:hypothetical protein
MSNGPTRKNKNAEFGTILRDTVQIGFRLRLITLLTVPGAKCPWKQYYVTNTIPILGEAPWTSSSLPFRDFLLFLILQPPFT